MLVQVLYIVGFLLFLLFLGWRFGLDPPLILDLVHFLEIVNILLQLKVLSKQLISCYD